MMKEISKEAGLSQTYTNHCVRATTCTVLQRAGASTREIMAVTQVTKHESSVRSYTHKLDKEQRQFVSDALSTSRDPLSVVPTNVHNQCLPNVTNTNVSVVVLLLGLTFAK